MKAIKITILVLVTILASSCSKDEDVKLIETASVKIIDMNNVGDNFDNLSSEIQSNKNLDFVIGDFKMEMRNMKPAEGISVENTIIIEDERDDKTVIIDQNTQSIYVRYTDIDTKNEYILYGFKNPNQLKELVSLDENNIDLLAKSTSYKTRSNKSLTTLSFSSTETSFLIKKPILTTKEELSHVRKENNITCPITDDLFEDGNVEESSPSTDKNSQSNSKSQLIWNIVIYKQNASMNTSKILDDVKRSFKSLSSRDGSKYFYSKVMYANLNITYRTATSEIYNNDADICFNNFRRYLNNNSVPRNPYTTTYMFLSANDFSKNVKGLGSPSSGRYRLGISINSSSVFAHELGHTLVAGHYDELTWDSSLGLFGWWGESVMHSGTGTAWYAKQKRKYYQPYNRHIVKYSINLQNL